MNALTIVVDGLRAGFLGCYGNAWVQTPAVDKLAAEGFVFDQTLIDSPDLLDAYRGYWAGGHALSKTRCETGWLPLLAPRGVASALITDEPSMAMHPLAAALEEIVQLPESRMQTAASSEDTQFSALFSSAADWIEACQRPFCLWLHAQGMQSAWDAPLALRAEFAAEDEVPAAEFVTPPRLWLPDDPDPDELLQWRWAYAAQVSVLDRCLEAFLEWFDAQPSACETLLILIGARGYPLGEHGRVGLAEAAAGRSRLHAELLHVPCIARLPDGAAAADRSQYFTQPADIACTLAEWFDLPSKSLGTWGKSWLPLLRGQSPAWRDRVAIVAGEELALRTPAWHLIQAAESEPRLLYAKPDDRWEMNEVANRCGEVADLLSSVLAEVRQSEPPWSPLAEVLQHGLS